MAYNLQPQGGKNIEKYYWKIFSLEQKKSVAKEKYKNYNYTTNIIRKYCLT